MVTQFYWFCLGGLVSVPQASHWLALPSLRTRISCESCPALVVSVEASNTLPLVIIDSKLPPACTSRLWIQAMKDWDFLQPHQPTEATDLLPPSGWVVCLPGG